MVEALVFVIENIRGIGFENHEVMLLFNNFFKFSFGGSLKTKGNTNGPLVHM
jgi:hypothetical protein